MRIVNPADGKVLKELTEDSRASLESKLKLLRSGQQSWSQRVLSERISLIASYSALLEKNIEILASVLTSEVGKPLQQSRNEVNGSRARIAWMVENAEQYLGDEVMTSAGNLTEAISYEPLGVICNISAWNYPYLVGTNVFVPALLAGNAVLYKPSEYSTLTGFEIARMMKEAGIPENVFQVAVGGKEAGEQLLTMDLDGYFFTGSYKTGKLIYEKVSSRMIPCQCELGGKDPLYVADDVKDIKSVAAATADGAFYNNGQSCCAVERIYVHEKIYDAYLEYFLSEVKAFRIGKGTEKDVYIGPLTRKEQLQVLERQINDAVSAGAVVRTGGNRVEGEGFYFEPTVLTEVNNTMSVMREESFGPVIGIMKVKDDEGAIRLMNDSEYGLTASVYSSDGDRAKAILKKLNAGTGYWNCCDRVSPAVPWSGRKHSGFGSTLSHAGLRAFTKPKAYQLKTS